MTMHNTFKNGTILQEDELRKLAPSIFGDMASPERSDKFRPIPTIEVLRGLQKEGFHPVSVQEQGVRAANPARRPFTKHMLRLRRFDDTVERLIVGDTIAEVVLKNANDGTSAYTLMAGLFRIACLNGMVANIANLGELKVRHTLNDPNPRAIVDKVIEGSYRIVQHADDVLEAPRLWSQMHLSSPESYSLAAQAHHLTFADDDGIARTPIRIEQLLTRQRPADSGTDLWTTFNVIQENVLKGGLEAEQITMTERYGEVRTLTKTKPIRAIDRSTKLNKDLFDLAQHTFNGKLEAVAA
jgi:hypothetical protein